MDPETVKKLALEAHGWTSDDMTACTLAVLKDLASGGNGKIGRPDDSTD
jgi:hypothetical protein